MMRASTSGGPLRHGSATKTPLLNRRYPCAPTIGRVGGADEILRYVTLFRLTARDTRKGVTYLNISSAPHTRPIVEAQGYLRFSNGVFVALPCLSGPPDVEARIIASDALPRAPYEAHERDLLRDHVDYGCVSLWCETPERAYPFVFRARRVKGLITCAQLIYCREVADFVRFARPLGAYLAWRGRPLVILDANGPGRGLLGKCFDQTMPKYFEGEAPPR